MAPACEEVDMTEGKPGENVEDSEAYHKARKRLPAMPTTPKSSNACCRSGVAGR